MKYPELFEYARTIAPISGQEWEEFSEYMVELKVSKGEVLLKPGQDATHFFIVLNGVLRNYDLDENGKEYTKVFRGPGGFLGPYSEILSGNKVRFYIQAVTDGLVLKFSYDQFEKMMDKYKSWERLGRKFSERNFLEKEKREYDLMHFNAQTRYEGFLAEYGALIEHIPQYQVASLLAISPEALNRMLKKKKD